MNRSTKNQLVKVLNTPTMRKYYGYMVKTINRHPGESSDSLMSWEIRLYPKRGFIYAIDELIGEIFTIELAIIISLEAHDEVYIELF